MCRQWQTGADRSGGLCWLLLLMVTIATRFGSAFGVVVREKQSRRE
jgi:hypothetical protein